MPWPISRSANPFSPRLRRAGRTGPHHAAGRSRGERRPQERNGRERLVRHGAVARFQPIYPPDSQNPCPGSIGFRVAVDKRKIVFAVRHSIGSGPCRWCTGAIPRSAPELDLPAKKMPPSAPERAGVHWLRARGPGPAPRNDDWEFWDRSYAARTRKKNSPTRPSRSAAAEDRRSVSVKMSRTTARLSLVECSTACTSSVVRLVLLAAA